MSKVISSTSGFLRALTSTLGAGARKRRRRRFSALAAELAGMVRGGSRFDMSGAL